MRIELTPNERTDTNQAYHEIVQAIIDDEDIDLEPLRGMSSAQQAYICNRLKGNGYEEWVETARVALADANAIKPTKAEMKKPASSTGNLNSAPVTTTTPSQLDYSPYKVHPVADLFPLIEGDEFDQLVADIRANGLHDPIILSNDGSMLVDGRNRYRACKAAGIEPTYTKLDADVSVVAFIISKNLQRRHLTTGQRAMYAAQTMDALKAEAKERQKAGMVNLKRGDLAPVSVNLREPGQPSAAQKEVEHFGKASEQAAKAAGVSASSVEKAKRLLDTRPDLAADVRAGKLTIHGAEQKDKGEAKAPRQPNYTRQLMRDVRAKACPNCKALQAKADLLDAIRRGAEDDGIWHEIQALARKYGG